MAVCLITFDCLYKYEFINFNRFGKKHANVKICQTSCLTYMNRQDLPIKL